MAKVKDTVIKINRKTPKIHSIIKDKIVPVCAKIKGYDTLLENQQNYDTAQVNRLVRAREDLFWDLDKGMNRLKAQTDKLEELVTELKSKVEAKPRKTKEDQDAMDIYIYKIEKFMSVLNSLCDRKKAMVFDELGELDFHF